MQEIQASEAKTKFFALLDSIEDGDSFVITRRGKPVARVLPPEREALKMDKKAAFDAFEKFRERMRQYRKQQAIPSVTSEEIIASIHEGHKY